MVEVDYYSVLEEVETGNYKKAYKSLLSGDVIFKNKDHYALVLYRSALSVRFCEMSFDNLIKTYKLLLPLTKSAGIPNDKRWVTVTALIIMERLLHSPLLVGAIRNPPEINIRKIKEHKKCQPFLAVMRGV